MWLDRDKQSKLGNGHLGRQRYRQRSSDLFGVSQQQQPRSRRNYADTREDFYCEAEATLKTSESYFIQSDLGWQAGWLLGLDTLLEIKRLTDSSLDWLLGVGEKTIELQSSLVYSAHRLAEPKMAYRAASVDSLIATLIEARVAPLGKEITNLKVELQRCIADTAEKS